MHTKNQKTLKLEDKKSSVKTEILPQNVHLLIWDTVIVPICHPKNLVSFLLQGCFISWLPHQTVSEDRLNPSLPNSWLSRIPQILLNILDLESLNTSCLSPSHHSLWNLVKLNTSWELCFKKSWIKTAEISKPHKATSTTADMTNCCPLILEFEDSLRAPVVLQLLIESGHEV